MSRSRSFFTVLTLAAGVLIAAGAAHGQSVGRVSPAPLSFSGSYSSQSDSMSRISRPAPADRIESSVGSVVQASYYQTAGGPRTTAAPADRVASRTGSSYGSVNAVPLGSLPPVGSVPAYTYTPTSYSPQAAVVPAYSGSVGSPYVARPSYMPGAANYAPTLTRTAYQQQGCGPTGVQTYPISNAPIPYATAPQTAPGARPFIPLASMPNQVYVSRGLLGQPVVYVPGQPVRNALRYLAP